jgi:O-antigen ligase
MSFEILVEILFPFYVLLAIRRQEFRPTKNPFLYALLAFFAVETIAMLLGSNPHRSLWSKPDRLTGMFFQYHLLAFFLMAGAAWRKVMVQPIVAAIITAVILSLHALIQVIAPGPGAEARGSASLGNPDYLSQYLVPHLFLAGWLIYRHWKTKFRWLWIGSALLIICGIISAQSKGALVGVFFGTLALSIILLFRSGAKMRKLGYVGFGFIAIVVAGFFIAQKIPTTRQWLYDHRFSIQYLNETTGSRKLLLKNVVKGIGQRPIIGWGPENFEDGFYFNYDPHTLKYSEYETRQDRPHNLVLETLHNVGAIGLLAYILLLFFAVRLAFRKERPDPLAGVMLAVAALAQVGTNLFIFETPMSYMALFIMFSLLAADAGEFSRVEEGTDESSVAAVPLFLLSAGASIWCLVFVIAGTMGSAKLTAAMVIGLQNKATAEDWSAQLAELRKLKTPYYERDIRALASHLSRTRGEYLEGPFKPILMDLAAEEYKFLGKNRRDFVHSLVTTAAYLSFQPRTPEQQAALEDSAALTEKLSPNRQEVEELLAQVAWEKNDKTAAEAHIKRFKDLAPELPIGDGWWIRWQLESGDPTVAAKTLSEHPEVQKEPTAWNHVEFGTLHLLNAKRWDDLIKVFEASNEFKSRNIQWDLSASIAYWALGEKAKSNAIIAEARKSYPDQLELVNSIEAGRDEIVKKKS